MFGFLALLTTLSQLIRFFLKKQVTFSNIGIDKVYRGESA